MPASRPFGGLDSGMRARYSRSMAMRVLRKRNRTKSTNRPTPPLLPELGVTMRRCGALGSGTHARYAESVGDRKINREAWAQLVGDLIDSEARGKKAAFARLVGVDPKTVYRWLNKETDVSEESVRDVARALKRSAMELLFAVGYYSERDIATPQPIDMSHDPAMRVIMEADLPGRVKRRMIERLQELRRRDAERQVDEVRWWIDQARGA